MGGAAFCQWHDGLGLDDNRSTLFWGLNNMRPLLFLLILLPRSILTVFCFFFALAAREWAIVQVTPKQHDEEATDATEVAEILLRVTKEHCTCHRESGLMLDRVWMDELSGMVCAEIVRTLPPPFRKFTPLISKLESQTLVCHFG